MEANGWVFVLLGIVIGVGGLWFHARLRDIASFARVGSAIARSCVPASEGRLPGAGTDLPPPGARPGPLRLLHALGPDACPDDVATANGSSRAGSVAGPGPQAPRHALLSNSLPNPAGPADPVPDDLERREETVADCSEAIRLDPNLAAAALADA